MDNIEGINNKKSAEFDLLGLVKIIWTRRKTIIKWCAVGIVIGLIVGFSIPKEYEASIKLAPEENDGGGMTGNLGALAAMAGVSMGGGGSDAVYPRLYPEIVQSIPFCLSLFDVPLKNIDGDKTFTYKEFLEKETKSPWWNVITTLPGKIIQALKNDKKDSSKNSKPDPFRLTEPESDLVKAIQHSIDASVDIKSSIVTITVISQDPMVSAVLADTVVSRLQKYVTDYRTNKARKDLEYIEQLNREAKEAYYVAQQKYAQYLDTHQGLVMYSAQTMRDRLENEATLAFNLFNQTSQQLQMAKAKVQEHTPVFATITPATVPIRASSPRKLLILIGFAFITFMLSIIWIIVADPYIKLKKKSEVQTQ